MSHLIGVFADSDEEKEPKASKPNKSKTTNPKGSDNNKASFPDFQASKTGKEITESKIALEQETIGHFTETKRDSGLKANLQSVFGYEDEEEKEKKVHLKPKKFPENKNKLSSLNSTEELKFNSTNTEEKKVQKKKEHNHGPKGLYEGAFLPKSLAKTSQRKEKREKRKYQYSQMHKNEKCHEKADENGSRHDSDEEIFGYNVKPEKPTLIKTLNHDKPENEISLEEFLEREYKNYALRPATEIENLDQEDDFGNVEYKLKLIHSNNERIEQLTTQMKFRLQEGNGEAKYVIGVEDNGNAKGLNHKDMYRSLKTLCGMASALKADVIILQMRHGFEGKLTELLVRSNQKDGIKLDIKIMLLGDKQSGKSTLVVFYSSTLKTFKIGVLTSGQLDNGKGSARMHVHVHKHEVLTGETSSLSHHIMGFDSQGNVTNHTEYGHPSWEQIVDMSTKVLTFLDIGGHEKYTTKIMSSLSSFYPDYALIVISGKQKVSAVAEQHLRLACIFEMPIFIVITHRDLISDEDIYNLKTKIEKVVREFSEDKYLVVANNDEDNVLLSRTLKEKLVIPVFTVSNLEGTNLDLFKSFLNLLPVNNPLSTNINLQSEFYVHVNFSKKNQIILGGTVINGCINKNQILFLGPDEKGKFRHVEVANIQCKKISVKSVYCGQSCTIEIKLDNFPEWTEINRDIIRRGMVLVDKKSQPKAALQFTAEVSLLEEKNAKAIIWEGYEPVITSQTTHQACIIDFEEGELQELTEDEIQILKYESNGQGLRKTSLIKEITSNFDETKKQRSKSEDFKDQMGDETKRKQKLTSVPLNNQDTEQKDKEKVDDNDSKSFGDPMSESELSPRFSSSFLKEDNSQKKTFQEKIKLIKKSVFKDLDELVSKRKKKKFISISAKEKKLLKFKFKYHPEYIIKGQKIIINDSTMKAIGVIKDIIYIDPLD